MQENRIEYLRSGGDGRRRGGRVRLDHHVLNCGHHWRRIDHLRLLLQLQHLQAGGCLLCGGLLLLFLQLQLLRLELLLLPLQLGRGLLRCQLLPMLLLLLL